MEQPVTWAQGVAGGKVHIVGADGRALCRLEVGQTMFVPPEDWFICLACSRRLEAKQGAKEK